MSQVPRVRGPLGLTRRCDRRRGEVDDQVYNSVGRRKVWVDKIRSEVMVETGSFEIPIEREDAFTVARQYPRDVREGHRSPRAALVGIEGNDPSRRGSRVHLALSMGREYLGNALRVSTGRTNSDSWMILARARLMAPVSSRSSSLGELMESRM